VSLVTFVKSVRTHPSTFLDTEGNPMTVQTGSAHRVGSRPELDRSPQGVTALHYAALAIIVALAVGLRLWRLGHWGLEGDEIHTLRDSLNPRLDNPRPLIYFLNYYLVRPVLPLNELGLRVLPALFGILAVPALYLVARPLIGARAGALAALLVTVNPYQVYLSQYGRYWSCVFLLSAIYPFAIYVALRDHDRRAGAIGVVTGLLAIIAHPVAALPVGGMLLYYGQNVRRDQLRRAWQRRSVRWGALLLGVGAAALMIRFISILYGWIVLRPQSWVRDHLQFRPQGVSKQLALILGYLDGVTFPVALAGALGVYLLWRGAERPLARYLMYIFAAPVLVLLLLSFRTALAVTYFLPSQPALYLGAGLFLARLSRVEWELRPRWLLSAVVTTMMIAAGLPSLLSQYRNGRRNDFRGAALWLQQQMGPRDVVFSDQFRVMTHYLPGVTIEPLTTDPQLLRASLAAERRSSPPRAVWLVAPAASHAFRSYADAGDLVGWIWTHCQLRNTIGRGRFDFRQQYLQIYRCPPTAEPGGGAADAP